MDLRRNEAENWRKAFLDALVRVWKTDAYIQSGREKRLPNRLRLRRGGGGGVGGCGVMVPRREISTSTKETVSPEARKTDLFNRWEQQRKLQEKQEKNLDFFSCRFTETAPNRMFMENYTRLISTNDCNKEKHPIQANWDAADSLFTKTAFSSWFLAAEAKSVGKSKATTGSESAEKAGPGILQPDEEHHGPAGMTLTSKMLLLLTSLIF